MNDSTRHADEVDDIEPLPRDSDHPTRLLCTDDAGDHPQPGEAGRGAVAQPVAMKALRRGNDRDDEGECRQARLTR